MTDYIIPCDVIARLGPVALDCEAAPDPKLCGVRFDRGLVVVTNLKIMVIENIGDWNDIVHVKITPEMVAQCKYEATFHGTITFTIIDALRYASAKTSFGYSPAESLWIDPTFKSGFDTWRDIVMRSAAPLAQPSKFGMFLSVEMAELLAKSSPSGCLLFESNTDPIIKPMFIRDAREPNWLAVIRPADALDEGTLSATFPAWMTE